MPISFIPTSTFGRYTLGQLFQSRNTYLVVQLLNVPAPGAENRFEWTWTNNWSNYVVPGAFSGTGGSINLSTAGGTPPSTITLYEEATSTWAGAYYDGEYIADSRYLRIYNNTSSAITFTHAAFFVMQPNAASLSSMTNLNDSLIFVRPFAPSTETSTTLAAFSYKYFPISLVDQFGYGGISVTTSDSFDSWVDSDQAYAFNAPYFSDLDEGYRKNDENDPYLVDAYKTLLGIVPGNTDTTFFAELLNVTGAEPTFEEGWSGWSTYRINRYSTATVTPTLAYALKEKTYTVDGLFDVTWFGTQVHLSEQLEFVVTPPSSSSYTFTHIAVFIDEADSPPPPGTVYVYQNTDKLIGVIKLPTAVTMTTSSTNRVYPFNFAFMYEPASFIL